MLLHLDSSLVTSFCRCSSGGVPEAAGSEEATLHLFFRRLTPTSCSPAPKTPRKVQSNPQSSSTIHITIVSPSRSFMLLLSPAAKHVQLIFSCSTFSRSMKTHEAESCTSRRCNYRALPTRRRAQRAGLIMGACENAYHAYMCGGLECSCSGQRTSSLLHHLFTRIYTHLLPTQFCRLDSEPLCGCSCKQISPEAHHCCARTMLQALLATQLSHPTARPSLQLDDPCQGLAILVEYEASREHLLHRAM